MSQTHSVPEIAYPGSIILDWAPYLSPRACAISACLLPAAIPTIEG